MSTIAASQDIIIYYMLSAFVLLSVVYTFSEFFREVPFAKPSALFAVSMASGWATVLVHIVFRLFF